MLFNMETNNFANAPSLEPPRKIRKIAHSEFSTVAQALPTIKPSRVTIIQRIQTTITLAKDKANTRYHPLYNEVDKNLTIFNLDGCEFLAENAPLTAISTWQNQKLLYQHFWVKNVGERRNAIMRAGIMLAELYRLPPCAIGITTDPIACSSTDSHYESLTKLRRSIWHFILTKAQPISPHIKSFLEAEMDSDAIELKELSVTELAHKQALNQQSHNSQKQIPRTIKKFTFYHYELSDAICDNKLVIFHKNTI